MTRIHKSPKTMRGQRALQKSLNRLFRSKISDANRSQILKSYFKNKTTEQLRVIKEKVMLGKASKSSSEAIARKYAEFRMDVCQAKTIMKGFERLSNKVPDLDIQTVAQLKEARTLLQSIDLLTQSQKNLTNKILELEGVKRPEDVKHPLARKSVQNTKELFEELKEGRVLLEEAIRKGEKIIYGR